MSIWTLAGIAVSLSMDACAVAIAQGMVMRRVEWARIAVTALFFGVFQALMPIAGYFLGRTFAGYIQAYDHWIAFAMLGFIGGRMVWNFFFNKQACEDAKPADLRTLFTLSVATSLDALAVGVSLAFLNVNIWQGAGLIGVTTFVLALLAMRLGSRLRCVCSNWAELAGGLVLVGIGAKILVEHLMA